MKGPFELLADLYDYQYEYYRWFLHRRLIFSEINAETIKKDLKFNIFENKDYENIGSLVKQSTLIGASVGIGLAPFKYISVTDMQKKTFRKAFPAAFGVFALWTGIGLAYGAIVNASANFRGQKNDVANHAIAAMLTLPAMGVYAKTNKIQWGIMNAIVGAGFLSFLKYAYSGRFIGVDPAKQNNRLYIGSTPSHYKP